MPLILMVTISRGSLTFTHLLSNLGGSLDRHAGAFLLGDLLAVLFWNLLTVLFGNLLTVFLGNLDGNLLTVFLRNLDGNLLTVFLRDLLTLLCWLLDRNIGAALLRDLLAFLSISSIPTMTSRGADLLVAGGAFLLIGSLISS